MMDTDPSRERPGCGARFLRSEDGSATVEACIWLPFFFFFFLLILDATFIFLRQADAQRIVQDGSRLYVVGAIKTTSDLETWLESSMAPISPNAKATTNIGANGFLTAQISYPAEDTDLTGATGMLGGATMRVQSVQILEQ
jgi:Flp pilus assembly protein TadG